MSATAHDDSSPPTAPVTPRPTAHARCIEDPVTAFLVMARGWRDRPRGATRRTPPRRRPLGGRNRCEPRP